MFPAIRWSHLLVGVIAVAAMTLLAACASDEEAPPPPRDLRGILTDETLDELADEAWLAAGFDGVPTAVDDINGRTVGTGSVTVVDGSLDTAATAAGLPPEVDYGAAGGLTLPSGAPAVANGVSHSLEAALTPLVSTTFNLTGTHDCPVSGTVAGDGAIALEVQQTLTGVPPTETIVDGTVRTHIDDLVFVFNACETLTHRMWGTVLIAVDNLLTATQIGGDPLIHDIQLLVSERVQAGLAYEDLNAPGTYYRIRLRYTRMGLIDAARDKNLQPNDPNELVLLGSLAASVEANGVVCQTTVTFDGGADDNGVVVKPACALP